MQAASLWEMSPFQGTLFIEPEGTSQQKVLLMDTVINSTQNADIYRYSQFK